MSLWTRFRDKTVKTATLGMYDPEKIRHNQADQRHLINEQIKSYQEQTQLTKDELNRVQTEKDAEKRRVEEKQIRALRRNYRASSAGLLGQGEPATEDTSNQLGG